MVTQANATKDKPSSNNEGGTNVSKEPAKTPSPPNNKTAKQSHIMAKMFSNLNNHGTVDLTVPDDDEETIQQICVLELERYLRDAKK